MVDWIASAWPALASAAVKSTLVLGAAWMIAWLLRGRSAAARHMVWTASAAALVALPILTVVLPSLHLRAANAVLPADGGIVFHEAAATAGERSDGLAVRPSPARGAAAVPSRAPRIDGKTAVMLLWIAGIGAGFLQMLAAAGVLSRLRRAARVSPDQAAADRLAAGLGIAHPVRVLETPAGMPMTFGVLRPTVLLPQEARGWSEERRRVVLLHELAHVLRGDVVTHLLARTALALNWWNPLAWTGWREFLKERERATDDLVLGAGATASDYASHLLEIARSMQARPAGAVAGVAMARRSQLEGRLLAILDGRTQRGQQGRAATVAVMALAVTVMAPLAAVRAQSQAEQNPPPAVEATIMAANAQKNHDILDQAAVTYEQLRKFAEAQKLREASLALAEQQSGQLSKDYAAALVKLGDLARKRGARQEATDYYNRALALGDRPEAFTALMNLGRNALHATTAMGALTRMVNGDPSAATGYFQRARNVAGNGNDMGTALTWMAIARQSELDGAPEAESLYRGAMASEDPNSAEQALTLEFYAQFLKAQNRDAEATPIEARSKAIRRARVSAMGRGEPAVAPLYKAGGAVKAPTLAYKLEPQYTEEARSAKYQGTVKLQVVVDVDGLAKNIQVVNPLGMGLDEQAVLAIQRWKFNPGEKDGAPVPVQATIEVNFKLL